MRKEEATIKGVVTAVLVVWFVLGPQVGYSPVGEATGTTASVLWEHVAWMVSHGNVWHLAGNVLVLWMLRLPLYLVAAVVISFLCSWLPVLPGVWEMVGCNIVTTDGAASVTMGFSGVIFAIGGVKWGRVCCNRKTYRTFCARVLPLTLIGILIPHINWSIHFYCLMGGFVYGRVRWAGTRKSS